MNNTFQINRFSNLVKETLSNKRKAFLITLIVVAALPLLLASILNSDIYAGYSLYFQGRFYRIVFAVISIAAPYLFFFNVNRKEKSVHKSTPHASPLERFLNMALFCFVLVPLFVVIVYGGMHYLFSLIFPEILYQFDPIILQHLFLGRLFSPFLFLTMQVVFF